MKLLIIVSLGAVVGICYAHGVIKLWQVVILGLICLLVGVPSSTRHV